MEYLIKRSDRKSICINIKDGRVILRCPRYVSDKDADLIIERNSEWIKEKLSKHTAKNDIFKTLTEEQKEKMRADAKIYFASKTEYFSKIMNLKYSRIRITGALTRFGSCSSEGNISFSYYLMLYSEPAREYVIVHELAHLLEMNHSKKFYSIIEKYMPDYKQRKKLLKAEVAFKQ